LLKYSELNCDRIRIENVKFLKKTICRIFYNELDVYEFYFKSWVKIKFRYSDESDISSVSFYFNIKFESLIIENVRNVHPFVARNRMRIMF